MKTLNEVLKQLTHVSDFGVLIRSDENMEIIPIEKLGKDLTKFEVTQCSFNDATMQHEIRIKKIKEV